MKEGFEAKLESLGERTDDFLTISEIGIDQIIVDEAQEFRKLASRPTRHAEGVDPDGSQRAWDLFVKARFHRYDQSRPRAGHGEWDADHQHDG